MTGNAVKQLQDYLVSIGLMSRAQVNTGYGTYGPQTTAAVKALQQQLGVDNSTGPGYWGPRTISAVSSQGASGTSAQAPATNQWYDLASQDPFIATLLKDPAKRAQFDSLPDELKPAFIQTAMSLGKSIESGKVVNPNIEISPSQLRKFYAQAQTELDPYYNEQFNQLKGNLDLSLKRMEDDYNRVVAQSKDPFQQTLKNQANQEANQGTAFSSGRIERENRTIGNTQNSLDDLYRGVQRGGQDLLRGYESQVGSSKARQLNLPSISPVKASTGGLASDQARVIDSNLLGGVSFGTVGASRETSLRQRQNELESIYRTNRVLNLSPLSY